MAATVPVADREFNVTSRPFIENCEVIWPRNDKCDVIHTAAGFSATANPRDFYVIHPDWTSESLYTPPTPATSPGCGRRPWLWEYPGARRLFYADRQQQLRARLLRQSQAEAAVPRLHTDRHYAVRHNSPWYVNNPSEVIDSNPLEKVRPMPGSDGYHLRPWNNARQVLGRELANPVLPQIRVQARAGEAAGRPMSQREVRDFRCRSGQYVTACDWS